MIARRMAAVVLISGELFDWSPEVWVSPERSRVFRPELSAGVELSSAKADTATTERQSMDIVIRFIFIVGRRRMAARLETELILSVVPFFPQAY
jgi:hypothetical protein